MAMKWISDLIDLVFPRSCMVCDELLSPQEKDICLDCLSKLPKIEKIHLEEIEKTFWGKIAVERATSYIYYHKNSPYNNIIHNLKYRDRPEAGERLAFIAGTEIAESGFFDGIDAIVPLPLSKKKQRKRGYNQSEILAGELSLRLDRRLDTKSLVRIRDTPQQARLSLRERIRNVEGAFKIERPELVRGRTILLIDDVTTTMSTLENCAKVLKEAKAKAVWCLTLARRREG
jgi:ComF family protein